MDNIDFMETWMTATDPPVDVPEFFSLQVRDARRFYLDLAPQPACELAVVCGGRELCIPDYAIHRSTFPYYSIEFVAKGKGSIDLGGRRHALLPGSVFSYGPGIAQDITTDRLDPLVKYFVDFTGRRAAALLRRHGLVMGSCVRVVAISEIEGVFEALIRDGLKGTGVATDLCAALLEYLVLKLVEARVSGQTGQTQAYATYQRCRQHMVDHSVTLMSLDGVARECHIDRAYLCRLFRRYDHQTPHQFLMRRKMNLAAERLQVPEMLVKQVAAELGFEDPFHFSRTFKRVFGLAPGAFRQQFRG